MKRLFASLMTMISLCYSSYGSAFVTADLMGQLGNQFFIIAAATSLALDHQVEAVFPDLINLKTFNIPTNYEYLFSHLTVKLNTPAVNYYLEKNFSYDPIPYSPNIKIRGWFQSEKYFRHHQKEIVKLFLPSPQILEYLHAKYDGIINHPKTVSIHYRAYQKEDPKYATVYGDCGLDYYEKAMSLFSPDSLFVVFSDDVMHCKEMFQKLPYQFYYIEGERHYHDLYLMSFCKDNIICNSSFSWWGAYLNTNTHKIVVAPSIWFHPSYPADTKDLLPEDWIIIK